VTIDLPQRLGVHGTRNCDTLPGTVAAKSIALGALPQTSLGPRNRNRGAPSLGFSKTKFLQLRRCPTDHPATPSWPKKLTINLNTAKRLDITFPLPLLRRADEVIE
jgi:hypothetical protein